MADKQVTYVMNLRGQFESRLNKSNVAAQRFDKSMGSMIARFATFAAVGGVLVNSIKKIADFEEAVSNLSAITGASGDDLDYLKAKAIEMGKATTKSSIDTITAFKLIASSKPELLTNAQALAATTKEAIVLSEASGLALPDAARALTGALNQFNLGADESSRLINVLAAGAKFAGAEIPDLSASMLEFGGIANSMGLSFEQAAASAEAISGQLKGSRAGMQLRNVFLRLASSTDRKLNPSIVGLNAALENLAPIQDDVNALEKMFGRQNVIAAQTLIQQRKEVENLTVALTGTSTAYEQASVNTDNLNSDVKRLSSAWEGFVLNLNQGEGQISGFFRSMVKGVTNFIDLMDMANKSVSEIRKNVQLEVLSGSAKEDIKEFEAFVDKIGVQRGNIEELRKTADRFLKVDQDRLAEMQASELSVTFDKDQIDILQNRINAIRKFVDIQKKIEPVKDVSKIQDDTTAGVTKITAGAPKVFNITVQKMAGIETLNTTTIKEGIQQTGASVLEQLQIALADMQVVAS